LAASRISPFFLPPKCLHISTVPARPSLLLQPLGKPSLNQIQHLLIAHFVGGHDFGQYHFLSLAQVGRDLLGRGFFFVMVPPVDWLENPTLMTG
jgi:hypothetical protein